MIIRLLVLLLGLAVPASAGLVMSPTGVAGGGGGSAPIVDPGSVATGSFGSTTFGNVCTVTTSANDETIFAAGLTEGAATAPSPTILSIVSAGLTWVRLTSTPGVAAQITDQHALTGAYQNAEIWWARAATAGTYVAGVTTDIIVDAASFVCWAATGVHPTAPQDANASLAATAAASAGAHPTVSGISTTTANTLLVSVATTADPSVDCPGLTASAPAGFTNIGTVNFGGAVANYACVAVAAKAVSAVQSGITVAWTNATAWPNWMTIVTAIAPPAGTGGGATLFRLDTSHLDGPDRL